MFHTLHYIEHIIAEFLCFTDKIHEEDSLLIAILFIIDTKDIAIAEFIAEIIDFTLFVVCSHNLRHPLG